MCYRLIGQTVCVCVCVCVCVRVRVRACVRKLTHTILYIEVDWLRADSYTDAS